MAPHTWHQVWMSASLSACLADSDAPQVRTPAAALCTLPLMPPGLHCPAALGGEVLLRFAAGGQDFQAVRIQNSGCRTVTGVGPTRW